MEETALTLTWDQVTGIALNIGLFVCIVMVLALVSYTKAFCALRDTVLEKLGVEKAPKALSVPALFFWTVLFLILLLSLVAVIFNVISNPVPLSEDAITEQRWLLVRMTALVATLGAVVALPFTLIKTRQNERQTKATEEGLITDRINSAVAGLGAEKTVDRIGRVVTVVEADETQDTFIQWKGEPPFVGIVTETGKWQVFSETQPNLEVRIGAILALERLASNNLDIHVQVMQLLCVYIRENAPASNSGVLASLKRSRRNGGDLSRRSWLGDFSKFKIKIFNALSGLKVREDIQVALTVLGRRSEPGRQKEARYNNSNENAEFTFDLPAPEIPDLSLHDPFLISIENKYLKVLEDWKFNNLKYQGYNLDLRKVNLRKADLRSLNFNGANFEGSFLEGANLTNTYLQGANLSMAHFELATLRLTHLQGARLHHAKLQCSHTWRANFSGADFWRADLQGVMLSEAKMQGAILKEADIQNARLVEADLRSTNFNDTNMQEVNLENAVFGVSTKLEETYFKGSSVREVDFSMIPQIVDHLSVLFGDASTRLPHGINAPDHWPKFDLDWRDFDREWEKWKADPDNYVPPDPPPPSDEDEVPF